MTDWSAANRVETRAHFVRFLNLPVQLQQDSFSSASVCTAKCVNVRAYLGDLYAGGFADFSDLCEFVCDSAASPLYLVDGKEWATRGTIENYRVNIRRGRRRGVAHGDDN